MNIYFIGMCISMAVYLVIGMVISTKIKDADDFYVAGRKAPVLLIAGSMIASYTSTGMFMGDAAQCYDGAFSSIILFAGMQSAGYIIGAVFFGRYLRRGKVLTIPEYFGKRFCSKKMRMLAAITAIITMTVYLLSVIQGIGTLMNVVTGVNYNICIVLALAVFTFISVTSGSRGVLITDTLMASVFTVSLLIGAVMISKNAGGWFHAVRDIAANESTRQILSWGGKPGALYQTGLENVIWGLNYGVVWMSVCMVGPWQSSRYLMARDENVVVRSSFFAALGVFVLEFVSGIAAVMVNVVNYDMEDSSKVLIWAAMNMMPKLLGVILLTGVLAAGISSATTFLSLIGASVANDIIGSTQRESIFAGRAAMVVASAIVLCVAVFNPPAIFWIMLLGGAIVSSSWMPVALASIFSKRLTKTGAFCGMLFGFLGCFLLRLYTSLSGAVLPVYLDPSIVGIICNILAMILGTALTQVTDEEKEARAALFVMPETEKNAAEMRKTLKYTRLSVLVGISFTAMMLALWVIPYLSGLK
ncbi:MAG: sodium:solute symporter family protein [Eubacteriales bacterium]|nr:sodium:solute symporter family protein [Eubacteriales bacterium]